LLEETFYQGSSFLHRADPRAKVICVFFLAFAIAYLHKISAAMAGLLVGLLFLYGAKLPPSKIIKRLIVVNAFIGFLWLFLPFSAPGKVIFSIWKLNATVEGIEMATLITLKCNAILLMIISFAASTPVPVLGLALTSLRLPQKLILLLLISYRYLSVIFQEYNRLLQAARIRCFVAKNNMHTYRTYAYLLAMVLIRSYERGRRVYQAMLLRGFNGRFYCLQDFQLRKQDLLLALGTGLCVLILIGTDHIGAIPGVPWGA